MIAKTFEIRDVATFIPILAVKLEPETKEDGYLLMRAGYGAYKTEQREYVLLCQINGGSGRCHSSSYGWGPRDRTYTTAHAYITEHFDSLASGAVICVETILGERINPKVSERYDTY